MNVTLAPVSSYRNAVFFLYGLLCQRTKEQSISHKEMPGTRQHAKFVRSKPYRVWFIVKLDHKPVGSIYATRQNEIGIQILNDHCGQRIGSRALELLLSRHKPLPAVLGRRAGQWLAHINPANQRSIDFFTKAGFTVKSYTLTR